MMTIEKMSFLGYSLNNPTQNSVQGCLRTLLCTCCNVEFSVKRNDLGQFAASDVPLDKRTVGFRLPKEAMEAIALLSNKDINKWCRNAVLEKLEKLAEPAEAPCSTRQGERRDECA